MPDQAEYRLHCFVSDVLAFGCREDVVYFHVPNGEHRSISTARRLKRMSVLPGVSDFVFVTYGARVDFLELKSPTGRPTPEQMAFQARVVALGCRYEVARSGQEAVEILRAWGILERVRIAA